MVQIYSAVKAWSQLEQEYVGSVKLFKTEFLPITLVKVLCNSIVSLYVSIVMW